MRLTYALSNCSTYIYSPPIGKTTTATHAGSQFLQHQSEQHRRIDDVQCGEHSSYPELGHQFSGSLTANYPAAIIVEQQQ